MVQNPFNWQEAYQGGRWVRADLHLHSPGSQTFRLPPGMSRERDQDREKIVEQYVLQLANQGIRICAITDYQGICKEWFILIRERAQRQGIYVFPGAELSFSVPKHGLHILAVFPFDENLDAINRAIQAMHRDPSEVLVRPDGSHIDIDPRGDIRNLLLDLRHHFHPLFIMAHPNDTNGLLKSYASKDAAKFISEVRPDAIEDFSESDQNRLVSCTDVLPKSGLRRIARVLFSDPKCIEEIGAKMRANEVRATWLKLSVFDDINSLRLALHDSDILVRAGKEPEATRHSRFLALEVDGNGFLGGLSLAFSPELNVFVGGRGVGKSAILETIRYVLDLPPYAPTEYRDSLIRHALGSGGKAVLFLEQVTGPAVRRYRIERVLGESPLVFELDPERQVGLAPLDILGDQESPLFFGQREIYEVTRDERRRLRLLDEVIGRQARLQLDQVRKLESMSRDNARKILEIRQRLQEQEEIERRLKEIEHEMELYRREGVAAKLKEATALTSDEQRLLQTKEAVQKAVEEWKDMASRWIDRWQGLRRQLGEAESSQKGLLLEAQEVLQAVQSNLEQILHQGASHLLEAQERILALLERWKEARRPLDEQLRRVKQELGEQSLDPDRLIRLTEEQARLEPQLRALRAGRDELGRLEQDRRDLLRRLRDARREVWRLRSRQAQDITERLEGRVRLDVEYKGQKDAFGERLAAFFQGSGVDRKTIDRLVAGEAVDGEAIAAAVREGPQKLEETFGITSGRAQQICAFLKEDRLFDLEILTPDDAVRVYLKLNEAEYPLEKLSDGQRATAMLLLLLVQQDRLLVVDQPEDDLDNRFVYEDIVRILRAQKGCRQILAATHNPNIPVLGHAELIVALEATEARAEIRAQGAIDRPEVQEFVKEVMEGGENAFRRRAEKYGWI